MTCPWVTSATERLLVIQHPEGGAPSRCAPFGVPAPEGAPARARLGGVEEQAEVVRAAATLRGELPVSTERCLLREVRESDVADLLSETLAEEEEAEKKAREIARSMNSDIKEEAEA